MDTTFIKMSEKAKEIQALKPNREECGEDEENYLSYFYLPREEKVAILKWDNDESHPIVGGYHDDDEGSIWLPTQAQLQKMTGIPVSEYLTALACFAFSDLHIEGSKCELRFYNQYALQFTSEEQLRLAFLYKEKYNKVWNGEDWEAKV